MASVIGFRDIYVAVETSDGVYDTPKKISPGTNATVTPNYQIVTQYGDDRAVEIAEAMGDIDIEIGVTDLTPDDYALLLGKTKNADGVIEDSADDTPPYLALGFRLPKNNGAFRYYWYYKGRFTPPTNTHTTKGENLEFQAQTITGKFLAREDGKWRAHCDSDDVDIGAGITDAWFTKVYEPTPTP